MTDRVRRLALAGLLLAGILPALAGADPAPAAKPAGPPKLAAWDPPAPKEGLAKQLGDLAGGRRVKVIWNRGGRDEGCLMGFDTEEGKERVIVPAPITCTFAFFTSDGERVVFSSLADEAAIAILKQRGSGEDLRALFAKSVAEQTCYVVDWDGKNLRKFLTGRHYTVHGTWRDPASGVEWVYVSDCNSKEASAEIVASGKPGWAEKFKTYYGLSVHRYRLDDPAVREVVWDKYPIGARSPLAADGAVLAVEMDWPACGVIPVPNGSYRIIGNGCNPHVAPDGSGLFFNLIGDHRTITMYDTSGALKAKFPINTMPEIKDPERKVWRPRWSNDMRLFTVQSADLSPDGDVWVGEFNEAFTAVKGWVRVTDTTDNDGCPLAWVEPAAPVAALGGGLTENLRVTLLQDLVARLEKAKEVLPLAVELDALALDAGAAAKAAEARRVIAHVKRWCDAQLVAAAALEATDPGQADKAYRALQARLKGLPWAAKAEERLKDPKLAKQVKGWAQYEKALKAEKAFTEVKGAEAKTTDKVWMMKNQMQVLNVKEAARILKQTYADTLAWTKTQELMARYEISIEPPPKPEPAKKPAEQPKKPK